ncbi:MAG: arylsulfatase [Rhodopirellula sp.]|nr:arylsulfatase [Rhodopirellula sp.]
MPLRLVFACTALFHIFSGTTTEAADTASPNIVVIFIDDMGYADINPFGATAYQTPNLNRMANEGRIFTDFVVSSAVCSASRSALLTGCYHTRIGIRGALGPKSTTGLNPAETTLAELCRSRGYSTAIYGKWHLGHHPKFLPNQHGFDEYYGIPYSNDMWPLHPAALAKRAQDPKAAIPWAALPMIETTAASGYRITNENIQPADQEQMTKQFTQRAVNFIKGNTEKPFFLYLPHPMVHVPLYASEEFQGKSGAGTFGDVVMEVDWSVGQILDAVEDIGAERNTLVVFTSDNGPWLSYGTHSGRATPLREGKGTMFEGGYREPTIMWWKGKIPAGTECDQLCSTIDLLPTVAKLIGAPLPAHKIDGKDILPLMTGQANAKSPHDAFYCYYGGGQLQAIRNEQFKLVFPHSYRTLNGHPGGTGGIPIGYQQAKATLSLFDLNEDVSETTNIIEEHPQVVKQLMAAAETARADLGDTLQKRKGNGVRKAGTLDAQDERLPLLWQ